MVTSEVLRALVQTVEVNYQIFLSETFMWTKPVLSNSEKNNFELFRPQPDTVEDLSSS